MFVSIQAAAKIQAVHRGKTLRKAGSPQEVHEKQKNEKAAASIQKTFRGNKSRNQPKTSFYN